MLKNENWKGHTAAAFTIFLWGTTFISTKVLLRAFTPVEILILRFAIGFLALWAACPKLLKGVSKRQELLFAAAGLCGVTLYFLLENIALTYTLASNVGVIISIAPFFTALFDWWFGQGKRPRWQFYAGFVLALAGVGLLSFRQGGAFQFNPAGDLLAIGAAVVWAIYSVLTKKISAFGYGTVQSTRRTFFYGLLFMIPVLFFVDFQSGFTRFLEAQNLLNLLFLGLGASALCFVTWNIAVCTLGSVKTCVYIYMVPVVTVTASAVFLKEKISVPAMAGVALTLGGLFLSEWRGAEKKCSKKNSGMVQ